MSERLLEIAKERFKKPSSQLVHFTGDKETDATLNDLDNFPHVYVLACLMDKQIRAERAWAIPNEIRKEFGSLDISDLDKIALPKLKACFNKNRLHRFNDDMADTFYRGVKRIIDKYDGNAANIWLGQPSSALVVYRFLEFKGAGPKIATMAANILARQFRVPFSDLYSIDISPDVHVCRVMKRAGFVPKGASNDKTINMVIYKARELNPEFPGVLDFSCWEIGKKWCKPNNPLCDECIISKDCKKLI